MYINIDNLAYDHWEYYYQDLYVNFAAYRTLYSFFLKGQVIYSLKSINC